MTGTEIDRTGHEKWLIYCPLIAEDTLLHLSIQGTSYMLRDFVRSPFKARDEAGHEILTTSEFSKAFPHEKKRGVSDEGVSLNQIERWRGIIARANLELGIGPTA